MSFSATVVSEEQSTEMEGTTVYLVEVVFGGAEPFQVEVQNGFLGVRVNKLYLKHLPAGQPGQVESLIKSAMDQHIKA